MESKPKDQSGVVREEHKGHGQDSHWEGRKCLNSLTMTKWWEPAMLSGKKPSSRPSTCLIPDQREHFFLRLLVWELWAVLYSRCRDLFFTKAYTKQGYELLSGQQRGGLRQSPEIKRRPGRDRLRQDDGHPLHAWHQAWASLSACTAPGEKGPQMPLECQEVLPFSLFVFTITF